MEKHSRLNKAAEKAGVSLAAALGIITHHHEMNYLTPKKALVTIDLDLDSDTVKVAKRIAKALAVDFDAVIVYWIVSAIDFKEACEETSVYTSEENAVHIKDRVYTDPADHSVKSKSVIKRLAAQKTGTRKKK